MLMHTCTHVHMCTHTHRFLTLRHHTSTQLQAALPEKKDKPLNHRNIITPKTVGNQSIIQSIKISALYLNALRGAKNILDGCALPNRTRSRSPCCGCALCSDSRSRPPKHCVFRDTFPSGTPYPEKVGARARLSLRLHLLLSSCSGVGAVSPTIAHLFREASGDTGKLWRPVTVPLHAAVSWESYSFAPLVFLLSLS